MNGINFFLIVGVVVACFSLITSRQQQRMDFSAIEREQAIGRRLDQDWQNLTAKQQELEQTERIEHLAQTAHAMERIPPNRTVFIKQGMVQGALGTMPYIQASLP